MRHYVIVGAGSAGCALAARLSEDPEVSVTLVEAGPPDSAAEIHTPIAFGQLLRSQYDWDLESEPEPALAGRRNYLPRGRTLGGSSAINAMVYMRGHPADYDEWAALGHRGWGFDDLLPYFIRSEDQERGAGAFHGTGGPLTVSDSRSQHPLIQSWVQAGVQAGLRRNDDFNGAQQDGIGPVQVTQRDGLRCSAAVAFLHPALERANLTLVTSALATRILFDGDRAAGVEIERDGAREEIHADEVILSAGAYMSPQLLMLSGIGPAADLAALGIEPRVDLPVGENLQDHVICPLCWLTDEESLLTAASPEHLRRFEQERRGPITSNVAEGTAFVRTRMDLPAPDIQMLAVPAMFTAEGLGIPTAHAFTFGPLVAKPVSRGRVTLRSPLPSSKPRVLSNYLTAPQDTATMLTGMRIALDIACQPTLRAVLTEPWSVPDSDSDADLLRYLEQHAMTVWHPVGTCAMGAVVDDELRVLGVEGLRVVDASIMPTIPRANTNAAAIMIGERGADLIRAGSTAAPAQVAAA